MIHLARAGVFAALFAACAAAGVAAPQPSPSPSPSPSPAEIGRVVTADRQPEAPSNTTHTTFVVDRAAIENAGWRTVGEALADVPGVDVFSYGAFGAQNNYGIRGTTSDETLVLQDGVPIATGSNGTVDLGALSTIGVQRIEVVESGSSTLYGSGATGGVINIITAAAAEPYARVAAGSFGDRDLAVQAGTGGFAVSFERHIATNVYNYPAFDYAGGNAAPGGTRTNDDAQQTAARASYLAQLGDGWSARLSAGDDALDAGIPGGLSFLTPFARQGTNRTDGLLDIARTSGIDTFDVTLSSVAQKLLYSDTLADLTGAGVGFGEQDTYDGRAQASLRYTAAGARADLVTGVDLARESALLSFPTSLPAQPPIGADESQAAAYAQAGYDVGPAVRLIAGVRGENDAPGGGVGAPAFGTRVLLGGIRFTGNVSESFRVPTLVDLYYPGFSNPDLLPEKLTDYDATVTLPAAGGITLGYFGRDGANLIVLNPDTFVPYNASHVAVNGLQFTLAALSIGRVRVSASLTDLYRALDTGSGLRLPSTPPVVATVGIEHPFDGGPLAYGAHVRVVGSTPDVPNVDPVTFVSGPPLADPFDGYTTADAYVRYRLRAHAVLSARTSDLTDRRYAPIYGYPAPGRTFELELATR